MSHQSENINKKNRNYIKKNQMDILESKCRIAKMKNPLEGLNSRFELAQERISKREDRLIETFKAKNGERKRIRQTNNGAL